MIKDRINAMNLNESYDGRQADARHLGTKSPGIQSVRLIRERISPAIWTEASGPALTSLREPGRSKTPDEDRLDELHLDGPSAKGSNDMFTSMRPEESFT